MSVFDYLDFYIEVTGQDSPHYQIAVRSKAGEERKVATFPYTDAELEAELQQIENFILYPHTRIRRRLALHEEVARNLGVHFFEFLLPGDARSLYYECQRLAGFEGKGVRINLLIHPPYLAALPWEFLYDPRRRDYIALDPYTPLVRYPEMAQSISPLSVTPPLRILGLVANPLDLRRLDVEAEQQQVTSALQPLIDRGLVQLTWLPGQSCRNLQQWMRPSYGPWHIFHFIGHGEFDHQREEGRIFLVDDQGQAQGVSATQLSRLFAFQRGTLRLAILNACEGARGGKFDTLSSTAATLVLGGLPAVLAMQYAITDVAALEFARTFYSALADDLPVDAAVAEARNSINLHNDYSLEWGTPVLFMRTTTGKLFSTGVVPAENQEENSTERSRQDINEVKMTRGQIETSPKTKIHDSQEVPVHSGNKAKSSITIEHPLGKIMSRRLNDYWKESFLPTVRKECGVRTEAALRGVKDIAVSQDCVSFAFGSNEFTRALIAEPGTSDKIALLLSKFLGHSVKLECQMGERAQQVDLLLQYAVSALGAKIIRQTTT